MKTKLLTTLALSGMLAFQLNALADDGSSSDGTDDHSEDNQIEGTEVMDASVILVATTNAPAGASGRAKIDGSNDNGSEAATLEIKTTGLPPGDYVLSIVRKSDGSTVTLGQMTISAEDDNEIETNDDSAASESETNDVSESESEVALPPDVSPMDIGQVIVSDTNGVPLLEGDFGTPAPGCSVAFQASVQITPDVGAPAASGTALLRSVSRKGKWKNQLALVATGVPPASSFTVQVNGIPAGTAKSNKRGQLSIHKLPPHVTSVRSVEVLDSLGEGALSAKF